MLHRRCEVLLQRGQVRVRRPRRHHGVPREVDGVTELPLEPPGPPSGDRVHERDHGQRRLGAGGHRDRAAFYEDEYVKQDGSWKIRSTGYKRTYEEIQSRKDVPGLRLTASWFESEGRSELDA